MTVGNPSWGAADQAPGAEPVRLTWEPPSGMVGLSFVNYLLRILTLGVYHFWGKTEVRRRVWSAVRLNDEPLEYTGTGKELFLGFLVVFGAVLLPVTLLSFVAVAVLGAQSAALSVFQAVVYAVFFYLFGVAVHRAQRYRLARTRWRGIRGGLEGSPWTYAWTHFWTGLLIPVTLGWIMPWRATKLQGVITNDMRFGNRPLRFNARSGPLYVRFAVLWFSIIIFFVIITALVSWLGLVLAGNPELLGAPEDLRTGIIVATIAVLVAAYLVLAVFGAWYRAAQINHFAAHTHFEGATFAGCVTAPSLVWLAVSNYLLVLLTLGLLAPIAQARAARYMTMRLSLTGAVPLAAIAQGVEVAMSRGEGLAQAFDVDAF